MPRQLGDPPEYEIIEMLSPENFPFGRAGEDLELSSADMKKIESGHTLVIEINGGEYLLYVICGAQ